MPDALYGPRMYAEVMYGEGQAGAVTDFRSVEYVLELRDIDGVLLSNLPYWRAGAWTEELNRPDRLTFTYPAQDSVVSSFAKPNEIWLKDGEDDYAMLQKFRILGKKTHGPDDEHVAVRCESLLGQLREEYITFYSQEDADGKTLSQLLSAYLGFQDKTLKVYLGWVSPVTGAAAQNAWVTNKNILSVLVQLQEELGGNFWVDPERRLHWEDNRCTKRGQQIRRSKNMLGIEHDIDYSTIQNRLYAYGKGVDRNARLNLIDAGEANEYIDDAGSQGTYKICAGTYVNPEITDDDTLLAAANIVLADRKDPTVRYRVKTVDLSQDKNVRRNFERLDLGASVKIIDEELGIDTAQTVVKVVRDLENTLRVEIQLSNREKGFQNIIAQLVRNQEERELEDTVVISTDNPQDVGAAAAAGSSGEVSDGAHVHKFDVAGGGAHTHYYA